MGTADPTPPAPELLRNAVIVDALNGRTMEDIARLATEYNAEAYDVFLATNPATGTLALWRRCAC
jgi:hypothetical protein